MNTVHSVVTRAVPALRVPALAAGIIDVDGALEVAVAGTRRRDREDPVAGTDRWHIGSCGKAMTAALYALLVQAGRAQWSAPVRDLFTDLRPHPGWDAVTVDDLLLHRAGVPANLGVRSALAYWRDTRPLVDQRTEVAAAIFERRPSGAGKFRYSNLSYTLAGAAIERITGQPYESVLQSHLFEPLGITSAGFGPPPEVWGHRGRLRLGNLIVGRGPAVDPTRLRADNPAVITPAGRIHLTIADWSRFLRLWLDGGGPGLLTAESVGRMVEIPPDGRMAMGWATARALPGASLGQQGSNASWAATALLDRDRRRCAMVVVNDGRTVMLARTALLAAELFGDP